MRSLVAKGLAVVTGLLILALAVLFSVLQNRGSAPAIIPPPPPPPSHPEFVPTVEPLPPLDERRDEPNAEHHARGREVYAREGCAACHSISGQGNRRNPLDGVGTRLDQESLRLWIVPPQTMKPGVRKPAYSKLTDEDLRALVAYLASLRDGV